MEVRIISDGSESPSKGRPWLLLGIIAVLAIALLVALLNRPGSAAPGDPSETPTNPGTPSTSDTPASTPASQGPASSAPESSPPVDIAVVGEVVPGLWRGVAMVGEGGTDEIHGVPVGWPQTIEGAVGAAMNYMAFNATLTALIDDPANQVQQRIYTADGLLVAATTDDERAEMRAIDRVSPNGEVLTSAGGVSPTDTYFGGGQPRYGAYRIEQVTRDPNTQAPIAITVSVMVPRWYGTGNPSNLDNITVSFDALTYEMRWLPGADGGPVDWRIADNPNGWRMEGVPPRQLNQGYQQLRAMLGSGWIVPADGTQDRIEGQVFAS